MREKVRMWMRRWLGVDDLYQQTCQMAKDRREFDDLIGGRIDNIVRTTTQWVDNHNKRLIDLETRNTAPVEKPQESNPAGSWTSIMHKIEGAASGRR